MTKTTSPLRDRELVELLGRDPELLAIADALVATVGPETPWHPHRRTVVLASAPVLAVAAAIVAVVLLWPFASSPSVLDNALAALGTRPVTHVVLENSLGGYILDLRTGARTPVSGRAEVWYRPRVGLFARWSFRGSSVGANFLPAGLINGWDAFVASYREQLRTHQFHVTGSGKIGGTPVYWIESTPQILGSPDRSEVEQVAISKMTFKPLFSRRLLNGRIERGSGERVVSIESTDHAPASLHGTTPRFAPLTYALPGGYPPLSIRAARSLRPPLIIRRRIATLPLVLLTQSPATATELSQFRFPGAELYYGSLLNTGLPNDREPDTTGLKPYLSITEFTRPNALTRATRGYFPPAGSALIDAEEAVSSNPNASLRTHDGLYVVIEGSSDTLVLAAAREIGT
jgi:hypothetical protein